MSNQEKLINVRSNIEALKRQLPSVLIPQMKFMLEIQLSQLLKLEAKLESHNVVNFN